jgi:hypothetical protein
VSCLYLQATNQETDPSSHRRRRTPHHHHRSLLHNLAKLIARDKTVSTFGIVLANHLGGSVVMQFGCSKVKGSSLDYPILTSFSCRYSMSYDISISLLKKSFIKHFSKSSRKGGNSFSREEPVVNQTWPPFLINLVNHTWPSSFPRQYPTSTPNHHHATTIPSEYSIRHLSPFFWKHLFKTKLTLG